MKTNQIKYLNAFTKVANILEPNVEFTDFTYRKYMSEGSIKVDISVRGYTSDSPIKTLVQVRKELHPIEGEQIVVEYIDPASAIAFKERRVWAWSFNWKALMET